MIHRFWLLGFLDQSGPVEDIGWAGSAFAQNRIITASTGPEQDIYSCYVHILQGLLNINHIFFSSNRGG